jgi:hypothetical protein
MAGRQRERNIMTFKDLDMDLKHRIADMLGSRRNVASLKFASKAIMTDMPNYLNCITLPAVNITFDVMHLIPNGFARLSVYLQSLLQWYDEIKDVHKTQHYPCIKIQAANFQVNPIKEVQLKHDPNRRYSMTIACEHDKDEQCMDHVQRTIHMYYNYNQHEDHDYNGYIRRHYTHKTIPGIKVHTYTPRTDRQQDSQMEPLEIIFDNQFGGNIRSFTYIIETLVGAFIELQNSIDTLREKHGFVMMHTQATFIAGTVPQFFYTYKTATTALD